ncbi:MAG: bile acid:sodium symporter family protein [Bacteroidales bacterium]|nr:bile acid:sodium symporter family protein [Bacteroidales bacterium]
MNSIFIVIPILVVLMFGLGLSLNLSDFKTIAKKPAALILGLAGQLLLLPAIAFAIAETFDLPALFYIGVILIACCPGGSSSNVFSKIAGGNVALSITLTALSSIITMFTIPVVLQLALSRCSGFEAFGGINLPVGNLLVQNIVLMFVPILLGFLMMRLWPNAAKKTDKVISKIAFPALMLLAAIFFIQHHKTIAENILLLGAVILAMLILSIGLSSLLSRAIRLQARERKTIIIEVGMQNAAQAIAIASSPFIFNNSALAIPAIIYALLMNVVLLIYVAVIKKH